VSDRNRSDFKNLVRVVRKNWGKFCENKSSDLQLTIKFEKLEKNVLTSFEKLVARCSPLEKIKIFNVL
jgi:hypothetical protein